MDRPVVAAPDALTELRALHRAGELVVRYGEVAALVERMTLGENAERDVRRAGALLRKADPAQLTAAHPGLETVRVRLVGHSTVEPVRDPLVAQLARHGFASEVTMGDFDGWLRELGDPTDPAHSADIALCVLDAGIVFGMLGSTWDTGDVRSAIEARVAQLERVAATYREHGSGTLVITTPPLQQTHLRRLVDRRSRTELSILWREFGARLLGLGLDAARVQVLDTDPLVAPAGGVNDPRMASYAKAHLGDALLAQIAREVSHLVRALRGRTKKMLVLDADNTLWDGILGDDGADGIAAATTFRGEAFGEFQRCVRQLASQGVLLSVSSKNDQEPVVAVLREHPDMVLRETDFVAVRANWNPKDGNIAAIAETLNLGLDSFVFADDSPFERGLVGSSLPQVQLIALDDEPALHVEALLADGWFDTLELTETDRTRAALYRADSARVELETSSATPQEYLEQLGVQVDLAPPAPHEVGRLAQLTLRTNQFTLTTQRLQPAELQAALDAEGAFVLAMSSRDRFGENGVIGGIFGRVVGDELVLDNMVMSCRVFARGIEQTALRAVLTHARTTGLSGVTATFRASAKNAKVRPLLPTEGFTVVTAAEDGSHIVYRHDLAEVPAVPQHVTLHTTLKGQP